MNYSERRIISGGTRNDFSGTKQCTYFTLCLSLRLEFPSDAYSDRTPIGYTPIGYTSRETIVFQRLRVEHRGRADWEGFFVFEKCSRQNKKKLFIYS